MERNQVAGNYFLGLSIIGGLLSLGYFIYGLIFVISSIIQEESIGEGVGWAMMVLGVIFFLLVICWVLFLLSRAIKNNKQEAKWGVVVISFLSLIFTGAIAHTDIYTNNGVYSVSKLGWTIHSIGFSLAFLIFLIGFVLTIISLKK